jgi:hypothetical protein
MEPLPDLIYLQRGLLREEFRGLRQDEEFHELVLDLESSQQFVKGEMVRNEQALESVCVLQALGRASNVHSHLLQ